MAYSILMSSCALPLTIQTKAATFVGYLTQLEPFAQTNNVRFDYLISSPQSTKFTNSYENAVELLNWNHNPFKHIITEKNGMTIQLKH